MLALQHRVEQRAAAGVRTRDPVRGDQGAGHRVEEYPGPVETLPTQGGVSRIGVDGRDIVPDAAIDGVHRPPETVADAADVGAEDGPGDDGQGERGQMVVDGERRARLDRGAPAVE